MMGFGWAREWRDTLLAALILAVIFGIAWALS